MRCCVAPDKMDLLARYEQNSCGLLPRSDFDDKNDCLKMTLTTKMFNDNNIVETQENNINSWFHLREHLTYDRNFDFLPNLCKSVGLLQLRACESSVLVQTFFFQPNLQLKVCIIVFAYLVAFLLWYRDNSQQKRTHKKRQLAKS